MKDSALIVAPPMVNLLTKLEASIPVTASLNTKYTLMELSEVTGVTFWPIRVAVTAAAAKVKA